MSFNQLKHYLPIGATIILASIVSVAPIGTPVAHAGLFRIAGNLFDGSVGFIISTAITWILNIVILPVLGIVLTLVGAALDSSVYISTIGISNFLKIQAIQTAWALTRDIANLSFIFILLYIAIGTILQISGVDVKRTIVRIILIALLINFSGLLTKGLIDVSNVVAYQFYKGIYSTSTTSNVPGTGVVPGLGISTRIIGAIQVNNGSWSSAKEKLLHPNENPTDAEGLGIVATLFSAFGAIISAILSIFVIGVLAILFTTRTVTLIILYAISPLAIVTYAIPGYESYYKAWFKRLMDQLMFAPISLFFIAFTIKIAESTATTAQIISSGVGSGFVGEQTLKAVLYSALINGLLIYSVVAAKKLGAIGAAGATALAGRASFGATSYLGRNTLGRVASRYAKDKDFQKEASKTRMGMLKLAAVNKLASTSFDLRNTKSGSQILGAAGINAGEASGKGGYDADLLKQGEIIKARSNMLTAGTPEERAARQIDYSERIINNSGLFGTKVEGKFGTILGMAGRGNRLAAANLANTRINELKKLRDDQLAMANRFKRTPEDERTDFEKARLLELVGDKKASEKSKQDGSIKTMSDEISRLTKELDPGKILGTGY